MFAPLLGAVRADMDRQVGWAREELRRQVRYTALIGAIGGMGALAAIGVLIVGLIAFTPGSRRRLVHSPRSA